jgi:GNAT superfamily N-acetyltransferase
MVDIAVFNPDLHSQEWEDFIVSSYENADYVLLSPQFLRWQFLDNPANTTGAYTLWLALHGSTVVAQLGFVPFVGAAPGGEPFEGAYPINLIARPEYRATGLGVMLLRKLLKETPIVLNPGANQTGAAVAKGLGMQDLGCLERFIHVLDPEAARAFTVNGRLPAFAARAGRVSSAVRRSDAIITRCIPPGAPESFQPPVATYRVARSRSFFRWRYEDHPAFDYQFILSPDLQNVLVFHEEWESSSGALAIRIVDFLCREPHQDQLLNAVIEAARTRGAAIVDFYCSTNCYNSVLDRLSFFEEEEHKDERIAALFQPLDFRDASIRVIASRPYENISMSDWYITKADSDQDRPNSRRAMRCR